MELCQSFRSCWWRECQQKSASGGPLTLLAEGLLKDRLVKAAEGGTEIFKFREQELLVPVGHVVLGLGGLLDVHGLGHGLWESGHLWEKQRCLESNM